MTDKTYADKIKNRCRLAEGDTVAYSTDFLLEIADELDRLSKIEKERDAFKRLADCLDRMLSKYRVSRRPTEALLDECAEARREVEALT